MKDKQRVIVYWKPLPLEHIHSVVFRLNRIQERAYKDQCSRDKALWLLFSFVQILILA